MVFQENSLWDGLKHLVKREPLLGHFLLSVLCDAQDTGAGLTSYPIQHASSLPDLVSYPAWASSVEMSLLPVTPLIVPECQTATALVHST